MLINQGKDSTLEPAYFADMIPSNLLSSNTAESDVNFYDYDGTIV